MRRGGLIFPIIFLAYLCLLIWCCFGNFSGLPDVQREILGIPTDKVIHFLLFVPFVILCFLSFDSLIRKPGGRATLLFAVIVAGFLLAAATEVGQSFTTYRSGDPKDLLADSLGLAFSTVLTLVYIFLKRK